MTVADPSQEYCSIHAKVMVVDGLLVVSGSANFTKAALFYTGQVNDLRAVVDDAAAAIWISLVTGYLK